MPKTNKKKSTRRVKKSSWLRRQFRFVRSIRVSALEGTLFLSFITLFFSVLILQVSLDIDLASSRSGNSTRLAQIYSAEYATRSMNRITRQAEELAFANSQALVNPETGDVIILESSGIIPEVTSEEDAVNPEISVNTNEEVSLISFISPLDGSLVSGGQQVTIQAVENAEVVKIEAYFDDRLITLSYNGLLDFSWNTRKATAGTHQWKAVATDADGNTSEKVINVTVQ